VARANDGRPSLVLTRETRDEPRGDLREVPRAPQVCDRRQREHDLPGLVSAGQRERHREAAQTPFIRNVRSALSTLRALSTPSNCAPKSGVRASGAGGGAVRRGTSCTQLVYCARQRACAAGGRGRGTFSMSRQSYGTELPVLIATRSRPDL
jgi:hypothetical protein